MSQTTISIKELKKIARKLENPLRELVLSEPDEMPINELIQKAEIWLKLCEIQENLVSEGVR